MRTLVIDTTSPCLSVALFDDVVMVAADHRLIGRGHAEALLPAIAGLPDGGRAERIWVGCGPGSFTGTRIGIAAARALGFAWNARVDGFDSLTLLACQGRRLAGAAEVTVVCEGGHGEWLIAEGPLAGRSLQPEDAAAVATLHDVAGDRADALVALRGHGVAHLAQVDAREAMALPPAAFLARLHPLYARAPDAHPAAAVDRVTS